MTFFQAHVCHHGDPLDQEAGLGGVVSVAVVDSVGDAVGCGKVRPTRARGKKSFSSEEEF